MKKKNEDESTFAPIKMLTSAHCLLRNRLLDRDLKGVTSDLSYESANGNYDASSRDSMDAFNSMDSNENDGKAENGKKHRGKRFGKFFRRGSKKGSKDVKGKGADSSDDHDIYNDSDGGKKVNFIPNSILRKSADQNPHSSNATRETEPLISDIPSTANLFENMGWFLSNLDQLCGKVEKALLKSFSQKITEWALQPWSANKDRALADGTADMRNGLHVINLLGRSRSKENDKKWSPVINPVNSSECLVSIIPEESYILPSAHFPLLIAFSSCVRNDLEHKLKSKSIAKRRNEDALYRTLVKINVVRGNEGHASRKDEKKSGFAYVVHAAVGGEVKETGKR